MRTSVDLPQPDGPDHAEELAAVGLEIDVVERQRRPLRGGEHLAEVVDLEDDLARLQPLEARAHRRRLIEIGRQRVGRRRICSRPFPHALLSKVRSHGNSRRPSSASTMSVPSPMMPIIMIAA